MEESLFHFFHRRCWWACTGTTSNATGSSAFTSTFKASTVEGSAPKLVGSRVFSVALWDSVLMHHTHAKEHPALLPRGQRAPGDETVRDGAVALRSSSTGWWWCTARAKGSSIVRRRNGRGAPWRRHPHLAAARRGLVVCCQRHRWGRRASLATKRFFFLSAQHPSFAFSNHSHSKG